MQEKRKPFERPFGKARFENGACKMASPPTPPSPPSPGDTNLLIRQNQELRDRLQEEASLYRRRLDTYKQAQQNQAALVGRLQSKVLQYKQKCTDLEGRIHETSPIHRVCQTEYIPNNCFHVIRINYDSIVVVSHSFKSAQLRQFAIHTNMRTGETVCQQSR